MHILTIMEYVYAKQRSVEVTAMAKYTYCEQCRNIVYQLHGTNVSECGHIIFEEGD
jgi:hypothetical protein